MLINIHIWLLNCEVLFKVGRRDNKEQAIENHTMNLRKRKATTIAQSQGVAQSQVPSREASHKSKRKKAQQHMHFVRPFFLPLK